MSLGSRTPSAGMTTGVGMGVVTAVVGVTVEVSAARVVTVSLEAVDAGVVTTGSVVGAVVTTTGGSVGRGCRDNRCAGSRCCHDHNWCINWRCYR